MRHIKLRQLEIFDAVVRNRNITRAAEELFLSQPAVSSQMKQLESAVGMTLIERDSKQLIATDAGERVYELGLRVAEEFRRLEDDILKMQVGEKGSIKISVATTVNYFAARILASFHETYPEIAISLDVTNRNDLISQMEERAVDIALMGVPPKDIPVSAEVFMTNPLVVIGSAKHPLVDAESVPLESLADSTLIIRELGSGTRFAMERRFNEIGYVPRRTVTMRGNEAIKQSVEAGLGVAVVSRHTIAFELEHERLKVLNVDEFPINRHWYCVWRSDHTLSPAVQLFKEYLLANADETARVLLGDGFRLGDLQSSQELALC